MITKTEFLNQVYNDHSIHMTLSEDPIQSGCLTMPMFPQVPNPTYHTGNKKVAGDDHHQAPPAALLAGVKEYNPPEHVEQDDGHGHEGCREEEVTGS